MTKTNNLLRYKTASLHGGCMEKLWRILFVTLLVSIVATPIFVSENKAEAATGENVYVGVTFGGTSVVEAEQSD